MITIYSYTPTMIFADLWQVEIYKHEIFYVPFLWFFKKRVRRTTTLFSAFHQKGSPNYGQEWLDQHPEIKLEGLKEEYVKLPIVK